MAGMSGLALRSRITAGGKLELWLEEETTPEPAADEVVLRVEAAPINPSDLGLLLGPADVATPAIRRDGGAADGDGDGSAGADGGRGGSAGRGDAGRERGRGHGGRGGGRGAGDRGARGRGAGRGDVRALSRSEGGRLPGAAGGDAGAGGGVRLRQSADRARDGRDHAPRGAHGAGSYGGGLESRADAQPDLSGGRNSPRERRSEPAAGGRAAWDRARNTCSTARARASLPS